MHIIISRTLDAYNHFVKHPKIRVVCSVRFKVLGNSKNTISQFKLNKKYNIIFPKKNFSYGLKLVLNACNKLIRTYLIDLSSQTFNLRDNL